ncbi:hypothetical protein [Marilutibacter aestuarii]|nr:hypothetical protein [Lysobacter aestuarii]
MHASTAVGFAFGSTHPTVLQIAAGLAAMATAAVALALSMA